MSHNEGLNTIAQKTRKQEMSPLLKGYNEGLIHGFQRAAKQVEELTNGILTLVEPRDIKEARARKDRSR